MQRIVVVLPAPLGPRKPKISPAETSRFKLLHRGEFAVVLGEIDELNHRISDFRLRDRFTLRGYCRIGERHRFTALLF